MELAWEQILQIKRSGAENMSISKLVAWARIARLNNVLISFLGVLVGVCVAKSSCGEGLLNTLVVALYLSVPALLVAAGGYIANDYFDLEIDRVSKPWRPLARGEISPRTARSASIALYSIAAAYAASMIGLLTALFTVVNIFIVDLYNSRLKREGLVGNLLVALSTSNLFIYGSLSYKESIGSLGSMPLTVLIPFSFAFLLTLVREIIKGVEDIEGDRRSGAKTLANVIGYRKSSLIAIAINIVIACLMIIPYLYQVSYLYLVLATTTIFLSLYASYIVYKSREEREAIEKASLSRSLTKISLLTGALAFLAWSMRI